VFKKDQEPHKHKWFINDWSSYNNKRPETIWNEEVENTLYNKYNKLELPLSIFLDQFELDAIFPIWSELNMFAWELNTTLY